MASIRSSRSHSMSSPQQSPAEKQQNDHKNSVSFVYQTHIACYWRNVTVTWSKNAMVYSLRISVESMNHGRVCTCKIELKPWQFWARKGCKTFTVDENLLEAYYDFRAAKFSSPEPTEDFYITLVSDEETVLMVGDMKKKAYKKTKARPPLVDAVLFYKEEHVFGKKSFATRTKFDESEDRYHDIIVEGSSWDKDPEMRISVDGIVVIHIRNLQWKFRGNQTVLVKEQRIEVFWDVHAWLFNPPGSGRGSFIFKPGGGDADSDGDDETQYEGSDCSWLSKYYSTRSYSKAADTRLFLYAWKTKLNEGRVK